MKGSETAKDRRVAEVNAGSRVRGGGERHGEVSFVTTQNGTTIQQSTQPPMPADSQTSSPFYSSSTSSASSSNTSPSSSSSSSSPTNCSCSPAPSPNPPQTSPPAPPKLGVIGLGGGACEGVVYLTLDSRQPLPLCKWSRIDERKVCQEARCGPFRSLTGSDSKQLVAYKVVTGLLCVPIVIFLLVQFGPQIYSTICKRCEWRLFRGFGAEEAGVDRTYREPKRFGAIDSDQQ
ncbi:hypothetical protein JZ751_016369 [Albula glossodonta]|uniref:Uncharacterized protein n=1 Tax=Albula glossodonta TaxID=121402 RepID=A0A8T2NQJ9_9TELE|nr:hypothetical protein JZ751_016369 [Albula glossodonta]